MTATVSNDCSFLPSETCSSFLNSLVQESAGIALCLPIAWARMESNVLDKKPVGLNLAPVPALEINLDAEVEEQVWAICLPGACFRKAQNSSGKAAKAGNLKGTFLLPLSSVALDLHTGACLLCSVCPQWGCC